MYTASLGFLTLLHYCQIVNSRYLLLEEYNKNRVIDSGMKREY